MITSKCGFYFTDGTWGGVSCLGLFPLTPFLLQFAGVGKVNDRGK